MTADNASNNSTLIKKLADLINSCDVVSNNIDSLQASIHCLAHIIHLAVTIGLVKLNAIKSTDICNLDDLVGLPDLTPLSVEEAETITAASTESVLSDREIEEEEDSRVDFSLPTSKASQVTVTLSLCSSPRSSNVHRYKRSLRSFSHCLSTAKIGSTRLSSTTLATTSDFGCRKTRLFNHSLSSFLFST